MSISLPFFSAEASEALVKCCSTPVKTIMCKSKLRQRQDSVTCVRSTDTVYRCLKLQMLVSFKRTLCRWNFKEFPGLVSRYSRDSSG